MLYKGISASYFVNRYVFSRIFRIHHCYSPWLSDPKHDRGEIRTCAWVQCIIRSRRIRFVCHLSARPCVRGLQAHAWSHPSTMFRVHFFIQFLCAYSITQLPFLYRMYIYIMYRFVYLFWFFLIIIKTPSTSSDSGRTIVRRTGGWLAKE